MTTHLGGCLCGAVRYEITGAIDRVLLCHCAMCRRGAGAPSVAWASAPTDGVHISGSTLGWYDSSPRGRRGFCARCGSSLFFADPTDPSELDVSVATLDDPDALPPTGHIFVPSKLAWVSLEPGLARHVEDSRSSLMP
ncbi:MAG: GFA family protein [Polyangiales bacterium]